VAEAWITAGPDIRQFDNDVPGFDANELLYYIDASISILPSRQDVITLANRRYEQLPSPAQHVRGCHL